MIVLWGLCALSLAQDEAPAPQNLFAATETRDLPNGLRVHRVPVPGSALSRTSLTVPVGRHHDPPDQAQTAHLLEHMLLSIDDGLTEQEFQGEIKDRGGGYNGFTADRVTHYYAELDGTHGLTGVDWLYRVIRPKTLSQEHLMTQRDPVLLELDAQRFTLWDHALNRVFDPPGLRPPGFWRLWFDLPYPWREEIQDPYRTVRNITPGSLQTFYDTWYSPGAMTLTIAGDFAAEDVWTRVDETWATLPARPITPQPFAPEIADHGHESTWFHFKPEVSYGRDLLFQDLDGDDVVVLLFLESWLRQRLQRMLRGGDEKATYSVRVNALHKGDAWDLEIECELDAARFDDAVATIEGQLEALSLGTLSDAEWAQERSELVLRTLTRNQLPEDITLRVYQELHRRDLFTAMPDLPARFGALDQAQVAAFLQQHRLPGREGLRLHRPFPLSPAVLGLLFGLVVAALWRRSLLRWRAPLEMARLRYVARVKTSASEKALVFGGLLGLIWVVSLARIAWFWGYWLWVATVDSYAWRLTADLVTIGLWTWAILALLARVPRKLLVFEHGVALKLLWVRAWWTPAAELLDARACSLRQARSEGPLLPLTWGRGVLVRRLRGRHWFLRVRDPDELVRVLAAMDRPQASLED